MARGRVTSEKNGCERGWRPSTAL